MATEEVYTFEKFKKWEVFQKGMEVRKIETPCKMTPHDALVYFGKKHKGIIAVIGVNN